MNSFRNFTVSLLALVLGTAPALALDNGWPRTVALGEGSVTIYAPQVESLEGEVLRYRAALAYRAQSDAEPVFGAAWLRAPVEIDEAKDAVRPAGLELTRARFPAGTADIQAELATALARQSGSWDLDFSLAELRAALDAAEAESLAARNLDTTPPRIIYRDQPALLVTIDGDPVLRDIENSPYRAVINTPFPLITDGDRYYLNAAKGAWYQSDRATGPYRFDTGPPADIVRMVEDAEAKARTEAVGDDAPAAEPFTADNAPEIVVSTEPAELIVTDGPADFVPLVGDLLVLQNSGDDVFMHVGEQKYYVVLAGRWYRASSLNGPWVYRAADELPADFAKIPDDSAQAGSRVHVAGTPEAEEAVLDAQVPQAAAVERGQVDIDVAYDGEPKFEPVDGTEELRYARNTGATVLESDRTYYLLEDGVWYVSSSPDGPWIVSDHRPADVDVIQPSSPVYNTKYVYIYDTTPEVVYVGYTPGYVGSYVHHHTIVYGTGWYYRPWVSPHYYYPRHRTWGFHVGYDYWSGWTFGLSWYGGPWNLSFYTGGYWHYGHPWHHRYWGYWGPRGYWHRPHYYGSKYRHYGYRPYGGHTGYGGWDRDRYDRYGYQGHDRRDDHRAWDRGRGRDRGHGRGQDHGGWDRDYGRDQRGFERYGRERHRNLYRDDRQRARVADTFDGRRDDRGRGVGPRRAADQRLVDNDKVRQSVTGPVRPADLRMKAEARDAARQRGAGRAERPNAGHRVANARRSEPAGNTHESRTTPITRRELRARADYADKRSNRPTPVSRSDLRQRADAVASRVERKPQSKPDREISATGRQVSAPTQRGERRAAPARPDRQVAAPARQLDQRNTQTPPVREFSSPGRQAGAPTPRVEQRAAPSRPDRQVAAPPPRHVEQRSAPSRPGRQVAAPPPRHVEQRSAPSRPSRQVAAPPPRHVEQRAAPPRPSRQVTTSPPRHVEQRMSAPPERPQNHAPARQMERAASRPQHGESRGNRREGATARERNRRRD